MELEMKYSIPDKETADAIWEDGFISSLSDLSSAEKVVMKAVYFDTEDRVLAAHDAALRVRSEGGISFATLKWNGNSEDGLHEREELNVPVSGETSFIKLDADMFSESEEGREIMRLTEGKELRNLLETRFLRKRIKLDFEGNIIELAIDTGKIITDAGDAPIMELELELFAGDRDSIRRLGDRMCERYGLSPLDSSKFARGLALLSA
ncbi:MAG: CYTH domain-containing protein [Firmicutes bacterium]|nr:CYTH domain-containing protein [Bacillota bacterium]